MLIGHINKPLSDKIKKTKKLSPLTLCLAMYKIRYDKNKNKLKDHQSGKLGVYMGIKRNEIELENNNQEINPPVLSDPENSSEESNPEIIEPEIIEPEIIVT